MKDTIKKLVPLILVGVGAFLLFSLAFKGESLIKIKGHSSKPTESDSGIFYAEDTARFSENISERYGFVFQKKGSAFEAVELDTGIRVYVVENLVENCERVSEYKGYIFQYDGEHLYFSKIGKEKVKSFCSNAIYQCDISGRFVYYIADDNGERHLFRRYLSGSQETVLMTYPVDEFSVWNNVLFMREPTDGDSQLWHEYDLFTKETFDHRLPAEAENVFVNTKNIYYTVQGSDGNSTIYKRGLSKTEDSEVFTGKILDCKPGFESIAVFAENEGSAKVVLIPSENEKTSFVYQREFSVDSSIDITDSRIYVTSSDGHCVYSLLNKESWEELTYDLTQAPQE